MQIRKQQLELDQGMKVRSESEVARSCPTLRDSMDCSQLGSSVHGIFQERMLEWVAMPFSRGLRLVSLTGKAFEREEA